MLKFLASRRVGGLDPSLSVHYVSQEVSLTAENEKQPPVDLVLQADVQRRILLKEQAELVASGSSPEKLETVVEHLTAIDADGAPARAAQLLSNLGFSETLAKRPMEALSGGCEFGFLAFFILFCFSPFMNFSYCEKKFGEWLFDLFYSLIKRFLLVLFSFLVFFFFFSRERWLC